MAPRFCHDDGEVSSLSEMLSSFFNPSKTSPDPGAFTTRTYFVFFGSLAIVIAIGVVVHGYREKEIKDEMDHLYQE
jgi:hypothetical protein